MSTENVVVTMEEKKNYIVDTIKSVIKKDYPDSDVKAADSKYIDDVYNLLNLLNDLEKKIILDYLNKCNFLNFRSLLIISRNITLTDNIEKIKALISFLEEKKIYLEANLFLKLIENPQNIENILILQKKLKNIYPKNLRMLFKYPEIAEKLIKEDPSIQESKEIFQAYVQKHIYLTLKNVRDLNLEELIILAKIQKNGISYDRYVKRSVQTDSHNGTNPVHCNNGKIEEETINESTILVKANSKEYEKTLEKILSQSHLSQENLSYIKKNIENKKFKTGTLMAEIKEKITAHLQKYITLLEKTNKAMKTEFTAHQIHCGNKYDHMNSGDKLKNLNKPDSPEYPELQTLNLKVKLDNTILEILEKSDNPVIIDYQKLTLTKKILFHDQNFKEIDKLLNQNEKLFNKHVDPQQLRIAAAIVSLFLGIGFIVLPGLAVHAKVTKGTWNFFKPASVRLIHTAKKAGIYEPEPTLLKK